MLTLFDYLPSQNAYKVRLLLNHLNLPYQARYISIFEGEGRADEYKAISPAGTVPAMEFDDGTALAESNAILIRLAEGSDYLPQDPATRSRVFQWLFFEGETIQGGIATLRHWVQTGKDKARSQEALEGKMSLARRSLEIMDKQLSANTFLAGEPYSIADMSAYAYVHLSDEAGISLRDYPRVTSWLEQVSSQPGFLSKTYHYSMDPHSVREL